MKYITLAFALFLVSAQIAFGASFERNLYFGLTNDPEVSKLQEFLASEGVFNHEPTGNFFSLTLQGVKDFQTKYGISPAAGYFGILTRTKANEILDVQLQASNQEQVIEPATPYVSDAQKQINALLQQISLLQTQLQSVQNQEQTLQSINTQVTQQTQVIQQQQQTIQQIQENTTPPLPPVLGVIEEPVYSLTIIRELSTDGRYGHRGIQKWTSASSSGYTSNSAGEIVYYFRTLWIALVKDGEIVTSDVSPVSVEVTTPYKDQNKTGDEFRIENADRKVFAVPFNYKAYSAGTHAIMFYAPSINASTSIEIVIE